MPSRRLGAAVVALLTLLSFVLCDLDVSTRPMLSGVPAMSSYGYDLAKGNAQVSLVVSQHPLVLEWSGRGNVTTFARDSPSPFTSVVGAKNAIELLTFSQSTVDDAVNELSAPFNKNLSVGARAIAKKLGQGAPAFQGVAPTDANAAAIAQDILENPTYTTFGGQTYDVYNAAGQGIRLRVSDNSFVGFLDRSAASR